MQGASRSLVALFVVSALTLSMATVSPSALAQSSADATRGRQAYMHKMCFTCHGTVGQGGERGTGPQIAPLAWPFEAFAQQVRHPRQDMPRYPARFTSDAELRDIYAYLQSIPPPRPVREIELLSPTP